ncbi:nonsense-mediated mRNA decay factor SMG7-like [Athalia rosae]|uniref:nonsense-mediated mRNA decay factor SMG7-like n=1 Tax=Athalia rosae TaxID=37344 RepID=UPI002033A813|nr:nonsense-mediated mRNA decay factor SMG7-like [Athalia rosae]XP_012253867.2 nonsense-mediated mRNA decay factor SMG7-like [Athalia rosae]
MGLKAAVQALKKAEPLKDKVQQCKDLLNDNDAWVCQQQLQKIYQQVLILDLEYALDRKVEQELWNLGFKNYIATLQLQAKDRKNPKRGESQAMLSWCLEAASGFYLTLLQEICTAFDLDLPFRRKSYVYGCTPPWKAVEKLSAPHKSSCFYACQYCLVHLGDIARYRNQNRQAELFYRHAVSLSPSSGQPYNQLALLEASRGDKLGTVFHYVRSVAVKHPFPVATANLAKTLSSALSDTSFNPEGKTKLTSQEYIAVFLKLHGVLHNLGEVSVAAKYVTLLTETMTALVATESCSSWRLVQMLAINLYALQHAAGNTADSTDMLKVEHLSSDEKIARNCILDLIAGSLSALLLPVYTIKGPVVDYFALPTIKLCLEWVRVNPLILEEAAFTSRLQIWPSLCLLLNGLQQSIGDFKSDQYGKVPLPEDRDLQGFLPLQKAFEPLRFTNTDLEGDVISLNKLRAIRILDLGRQLSEQQVNGTTLISIIEDEQEGRNKFTTGSEGTGLSKELFKELEELSLNKEKQPLGNASPVPSESASSKGSWEADIPECTVEKRVGILKPQGSLERSRDSATNSNEGTNLEINSVPSTRKPRQNVAMQALMRRAETEQKQVTFKNVSPVIIEEENAKIKPTPTSPNKNGVNKHVQLNLQLPGQNGSLNPNQNISGPAHSINISSNRAPIIQNTAIPAQNQPASVPKESKLKLDIPQPGQINQHQINEPQHNITQFSYQNQGAGQTSYQNQPFNVQNPQFGKNFMALVPNMAPYQFNLPQNMTMQQTLNQNRIPHQRIAQNLSQSGTLPQNLGQNSVSQPNVGTNISQNTPLQQTMIQNTGLQSNIGLQPPSVVQNNLRPNGLNLQRQIKMPVSGITNGIQGLQNLTNYQKSFQQNVNIPSISSATMNPANLSTVQNINYNPNFGQNSYNQMYQKQISPTTYTKSTGQFKFPNQASTSKGQQASNNYQRFPSYENKDFNLWKDNQPPQPPIAWWGNAGASQIQTKEMQGDVFQNWPTSPPGSGNMFNTVPLTPGNNYHQNPMLGRPPYNRNSFEEVRSYEVDQKQPQSPGAGNTYSLFSGNTWGAAPQQNPTNQDQVKNRLSQQSLWSGPGPSPLERLLEQQKSLREGGT